MAQAIVDHQTEFLAKGPESDRALEDAAIADKVGVHVTTVSRPWTTSGSRRRGASSRSNASSAAARSPKAARRWPGTPYASSSRRSSTPRTACNPYSDEDLVAELAKHGIKVARRTVTKYRKAMDILSSRQRRDWSDQPQENGSPPPPQPAEEAAPPAEEADDAEESGEPKAES